MSKVVDLDFDKKKRMNFADKLGFNIGIFAYIQHQNYPNNFGDLYLRDLQQLKLPKLIQ